MKFPLPEYFDSAWLFSKSCLLLAQGAVAPEAVEGAGDPVPVDGNRVPVNPIVEFLASPLNMILICAILFMFIVVRPQQKQARRLQQTLAELKKNDRVITASGIHGTVVQADAGDAVVTIRIDENSGARMKINRDSIAKIMSPDSKA